MLFRTAAARRFAGALPSFCVPAARRAGARSRGAAVPITTRKRRSGRSPTSPASATTFRRPPSTGRSPSSCWWRERCCTPCSASAGATARRAAAGAREHDDRDRLDADSGAHPGRHRRADGARHLPDRRHPGRTPSRSRSLATSGGGSSGTRTSVSPRPTRCTSRWGRRSPFRMSTADVVHSFWPPRFAGKRDVFPNRQTRLWFKAGKPRGIPGPVRRVLRHPARADGVPGPGNDPERLPGLGGAHADPWPQAGGCRCDDHPPTPSGRQALGRVSAAPAQARATCRVGAKDSSAAAAPAVPKDPAYAAGEKLFTAKGCIGCHPAGGEGAQGHDRPQPRELRRPVLHRGRQLQNTDETLARWIRDPQAMKQGVLMPNLGVTADEAKALAPTSALTNNGSGLWQRPHRPATGTRGRARRADGPVELADHGRPQAHRHPLRRDGVLLLPDWRDRGADDPDAAGPPTTSSRPECTTSCSRCTARR